MLDQREILPPRDPVPRPSIILLSVFAHLAVLALITAVWHTGRARILPQKYETAQRISAPAYLSFSPPNSKPATQASPLHVRSAARKARVPKPATADGTSAQTLHERAKQETAQIMMSIKFRQVYGFSLNHDYRLAVQTAGEIPSISAAEVPPHFQQYVVVEVTVDVDGRVAEARIEAGMVSPRIERTLLSAIREFKYSPATCDGVPIPSQLGIVIHIPT